MHPRLLLATAMAAALLAGPALAQTNPPPRTSNPPASSSPAPSAAGRTAAPSTGMAAPSTAPSTTARATQGTGPTSTMAAATHRSQGQHNPGRYAALYRRAEQKLKDMGYYSGPIDGMRNEAYVAALERFQADHHLRTTGRLNHRTRHALGV